MRSRTAGRVAAVLVIGALGAGGCGRSAEQPPPAETAAGGGGAPAAPQHLDIQLTTDATPVKTGTAAMDVLVRDAGKPVTDANVTIELHMPPSAAMGEMRTGAEMTPSGDGHYRGNVDVMMAGKWDAIVRVKRGGQLVATYNQPVTAQ